MGPAQVVRFDRSHPAMVPDTRSPHAVTITVQDPDHGRLSADWDGKVRLIATVPPDLPQPDPSVPVALARIGLLPSDGDMRRPRAELQAGDAVVVFTQMVWVWGEQIDDKQVPEFLLSGPNQKRLMVDLIVEGAARDAAQVAVAQALRDSSANSPVRLTIRGTQPKRPDNLDPTVSEAGAELPDGGHGGRRELGRVIFEVRYRR